MPDQLDRMAALVADHAQAERAEWRTITEPEQQPEPTPSRPGGLLTETEYHRIREAQMLRDYNAEPVKEGNLSGETVGTGERSRL